MICCCYLFIVVKYNLGFVTQVLVGCLILNGFSDSLLPKAAQHLSLTQMLGVMKY